MIEAFFNRRETDKVRDLARVIRAEALPGGGWSQYQGGPPELSVSCLSYFALKVAGEPAEAPHMRAARAAIRALGGVGRANTYTRHHLAMFGQVAWESVPAIPPEMLFFPRKAPFSVYDLSAWSRTIFVPLSIIWAEKPVIDAPRRLWRPGAPRRRAQSSARSILRPPSTGRRSSTASTSCSRSASGFRAPGSCAGGRSNARAPG